MFYFGETIRLIFANLVLPYMSWSDMGKEEESSLVTAFKYVSCKAADLF
jgi:hypothetical protein